MPNVACHSVDEDRSFEQPSPVAVVHVPIPMHDRQRLYRRAVGLVPAIERQAIGSFAEPVGDNDIFFDARDQRAEFLSWR